MCSILVLICRAIVKQYYFQQIDSYDLGTVWDSLSAKGLDDILVQAVITDPPGKEHSCWN